MIYFDRALLGRLGELKAGVKTVQERLLRPSDITMSDGLIN